MKKNLFMTFIFSFIPGCGQMYQKYPKRGLSIMIIGALTWVLMFMLDSLLFIIPFIIVEAYSFFDTFNLRNMSDEERSNYVDQYVWKTEGYKELVPVKTNVKGNKFAGIILIVLGAYIALDKILLSFAQEFGHQSSMFEPIWRIYDIFHQRVPVILVAIACVIIGIKMIKKEK